MIGDFPWYEMVWRNARGDFKPLSAPSGGYAAFAQAWSVPVDHALLAQRQQAPWVTWLGHVSVLLQVGGLNILTDPTLADFAGPYGRFGAPRMVPAPLRGNQLPAIDVLLISHNHYDHLCYATLRRQCGISLAMGEREYDTRVLQALIAADGIDLWQPDLLRLGSVEAWRASAALAQAHHLPVLPHYYRDYDVPMLCGIPNGLAAESFDWIDALIDTPLTVENGQALPREGAGWGFRFRESTLKEIAP